MDRTDLFHLCFVVIWLEINGKTMKHLIHKIFVLHELLGKCLRHDNVLMDNMPCLMMLAVIDPQRCIAWISGSCRVCVDACPYEALSADASGRPIVDSTRCNGCGICEYRCPSNTYRSFAGGTQRGINVERSA